MINKKSLTTLNVALIILSILPYLFTIANKEGWLNINLRLLYLFGFAIAVYLLVVMLLFGKKYLGKENQSKITTQIKFRNFGIYDLDKVVIAFIIGYTLLDDKLLPEKSIIHYLYLLFLSLFFLLHFRLKKIE